MTVDQFSAWIKEQRLSRHLTQSELAAMLNVSTAAVASWENGSRKAKGKTQEKFKQVFAQKVGSNEAGLVHAALSLTIREAKDALARHYEVPPESIDIIIRG